MHGIRGDATDDFRLNIAGCVPPHSNADLHANIGFCATGKHATDANDGRPVSESRITVL